MTARILIIEDEEALATLLSYNLKKEGYLVGLAKDGEEALLCAEETPPNLILLDWMLPKISGIEVCRKLRADKTLSDIPIIMLTARGEETDLIHGLNTGADDYIIKPFSMNELFARVHSLLRRVNQSLIEKKLSYGDIVLNQETCRVIRSGKEIHLAPTEYRLLLHLIQKPKRVFSREQLLNTVWGMDVYVDARTVDVHIGRLRKAINKVGDYDPIRTVRSIGYALDFGENYQDR